MATFIRLRIQAFTVEPAMKASSEAIVVRGTMPKSELKLSAMGLEPSSKGSGSRQTRPDITAVKALSAKASHITSLALR